MYAVCIDQWAKTALVLMHLEVKGLMISLQRIRPLNMAEKWPLDIPQHPLTESNTVAIIASLVARGQIHRKMKLLYCIVAKASCCFITTLCDFTFKALCDFPARICSENNICSYLNNTFIYSFIPRSKYGRSQPSEEVCLQTQMDFNR